MGLFLGTIDGRRQVIQRYSGIESLNLRLSEVMESRGTTKFSITGSRTNRNKYMKLFSTGFKGILEEGSEESLKEIERRMKLKKVGNFAEMMALRYEGVPATDAVYFEKHR